MIVNTLSCRNFMGVGKVFCPACRAEYRPGFDRCHTCDVALVHELDSIEDAPAPASDSEWVPLCTLTSETEARLLQGYLESGGISCQLESLVFHAEPVTFAPLSQVRVHVLRRDLQEAEQLRADLEAGS